MYAKTVKRFLDVLCSALAIILLWPLILVIAFFVRVNLGSPVIFSQQRPGRNEKIFTLYKFRTMTDERDADGNLLPDSIRLNKTGRILRSSSLDELPELWNIFRGDMSIVGPRPLAVQYLPYYTAEERLRHDVRPGLTGMAQVNGRNGLSWDEKFAYDVEYAGKCSFLLDISIVFKTIQVVFSASEIGERGTGNVIDFDKYRKEQQRLHETFDKEN